ncbi:SDR family oxidoreductase [Streptomyces scabiei]|uniref:SDR family oxidoreductase n=1 Tax=Streptomyces scabiei TaxID=1930 RepID=UPI00369508F0
MAAPEHPTRILAAEVGSEGIRVDIVIPGGMNTDIAARTTGLPPSGAEAFRARVRAGTPTLRQGEPDELADAVLFLTWSEAGHITGVVHSVRRC